MALAATVSSASQPCIPNAFTSTTCRRWNHMTWFAGSGRKDCLLCSINRKPSPRTIRLPSRLRFRFHLRRHRWLHRRRGKEGKSRRDFSACTARSPSGNLRIFGITSELTPGIGRFVASFATRRSRNTRTWEHTRAFTRVKNHLSAITVTKASLRLSRYAVTQELTLAIDRTTASDAANRLPVFPVWRDTTGSTQTWNKMNWKFDNNLISLAWCINRL